MPEPTLNGAKATSLDGLLSSISPAVSRILDRSLADQDISVEEAVSLFGTSGPDLGAVIMAADELRRHAAGDVVTYVVNRNINLTNVFIKRCGF